MEDLILMIQKRQETETGKEAVKKLKKSGFIPAVMYGEGEKAQPIKVSSHEFIHFIHIHRFENVIITLKEKEGDKGHPVLIKEIQYHPVTGDIVHIDFYAISLTKKIKVKIGVEAKGEAVGVKADGGSLEHNLWEIEIECLPTEIPEKVEVDISAMKIGDNIHVRDIVLPKNIHVITDPDIIVLTIVPPSKAEEPSAAEAAASEGEAKSEPEVIKKEKKTEEEEESKEK